MNLDEKLNRVVARHDELSSLIARHPEPGSSGYTEMLKELAEITPMVERIEVFRGVQRELAEVESLAAEPESDAEMRALAESERESLSARIPELEQQVKLLLLPKDEADEAST